MKTTVKTKAKPLAPWLISGAAAVVALGAAGLLLFHGCSPQETAPAETIDDPELPGFTMDTGAVVGGWEQADTDAIIAGLNEKVEQGMINISMNTSPVFRDGSSPGNLMIVNEGINRYPQVVEITRNDTGEQIYKSGGIPVGSKIESAALDMVLPAGTYECTAMFHSVDPLTGDSLGCAGAIIHITILNSSKKES